MVKGINYGTSDVVIITLIKNEEEFLPLLEQSILKQTVKPNLWILIDDGSTDCSPNIIKNIEAKHRWVRSLRISSKESYNVYRYGFVVRKGFDYGNVVCGREGIRCDFLAIVDADIILDRNYFEEISDAFQSDKRLGIASGLFYERERGAFTIQKTIDGPNICGATLVFRKECYNEIGGFPITLMPDTVSLVRALNRGWHSRVVANTRCFHLRPTYGRNSLWMGYVRKGQNDYLLNYHPINAILSGLYYLLSKSPHYIGIAYIAGYSKNALLKKRKIQDQEISRYFWDSFHRRLLTIRNNTIKSFLLREKKIKDNKVKEYFWSSINNLLTRILKKLGLKS